MMSIASGLRRPSKRPFPSLAPHVRPTRTQSGSSRAYRGASTRTPSAAPRRSERASSLAATSCPPPSNWRRGEPQDDVPVALAGPRHGPHAIDHHRLDFDEALALPALHGPPSRALGQRRGAISCRRFSAYSFGKFREDRNYTCVAWQRQSSAVRPLSGAGRYEPG